MLGKYTPAFRVFTWIPLFESTRIPARFALPFTFSLAVLAGLGLDALFHEPSAVKRMRGVLIAAVLTGLLAGFAWVTGGDARSLDPGPGSISRLWNVKATALEAGAGASFRHMGFFFGAAVLTIAAGAANWRFRKALAFVVVMVAFADLFSWGRAFNPVIPPDVLLEPPPVAAALPGIEPRPRIARQGIAEFWERIPGMPRVDLFTPGWSRNEASYATGAWALPPAATRALLRAAVSRCASRRRSHDALPRAPQRSPSVGSAGELERRR